MLFRQSIFVASLLILACLSSAFAATPIHLNYQPMTTLRALSPANAPVLKSVSATTDFNQTTHERKQQTYQGYRVWGGDIVVHTPKNKQAATVNGLLYQDINKDLTAKTMAFNAAQANQALRHAIELYQTKTGNKQPAEQATREIIIYIDQANKAHWAYLIRFTVQSAGKVLAKPVYILDATTLSVYRQWNNLQTIGDGQVMEKVTGGGFGGNEKMGRYFYDGLVGDNMHLAALSMGRDAKHTCYLENADVVVKDRRKQDAVVKFKCHFMDSIHHEYWDGDLDKVNGGYSPDNDVLFNGKVIKDMYHDWYNVDVLMHDGKPMQLKMRVHEDMDNAYWDDNQMTFGDGAEMFYPLVSLGVTAHEVSHGFTEQHSNLEYSGQSGGLNEAFSDMAAQAAEFYAYGHNSWEIGPEILKEKDKALRYMQQPSKDCEEGHQPGDECSIDTVQQYREDMDVHYTSGVFNRLFYLIGTAPNWDTKKAFDVMVTANMNYWTSNIDFADAACGVLKATDDHQYDRKAVVLAMSTVGLNAKHCKS